MPPQSSEKVLKLCIAKKSRFYIFIFSQNIYEKIIWSQKYLCINVFSLNIWYFASDVMLQYRLSDLQLSSSKKWEGTILISFSGLGEYSTFFQLSQLFSVWLAGLLLSLCLNIILVRCERSGGGVHTADLTFIVALPRNLIISWQIIIKHLWFGANTQRNNWFEFNSLLSALCLIAIESWFPKINQNPLCVLSPDSLEISWLLNTIATDENTHLPNILSSCTFGVDSNVDIFTWQFVVTVKFVKHKTKLSL